MTARTVKGSHVVQVKEWMDEKMGPGTFARLTKGAGEHWSVVLPVTWYEVTIVNDLMVQAAQSTGIPLEEISTEVSRRNAEQDLSSIYRLFLRAAQPQRVLDQTPRLWRTYVSFAEARALENSKGHYIGEGSGVSSDLVDWACGAWRGFIPTAITMAGGKDLKTSIIKRWREAGGTYGLQLEVRYT